MSTTASQSIARNTSIMMASQVTTWVSSFVLMMFLPRYLGSEEYGRLFLAMSVTTIIEILIHYGGHYHIPKEIALSRENAPHILINSIVIRVVLWVASMIVMLVFIVWAGYSSTTAKLILILGAAKLWEGVAGVMRSCFQGFERMGPPAVSAVIERVFLMSAGVVALLMGAPAMTIAWVMAVSTLLRCLAMIVSLSAILPRVPRFDLSKVKALLRQGAPYFLWSAFAVIYYRIDAIMLSLMTPEAVVGWYGAAYRIFDVLMFLPCIYTSALLPVMSRLSHREPGDLIQTTKESIDFMLLAGIPIATLVFLFAEDLIPFLFGPNGYEQSVVMTRLFSVGLVLVYVDFVLGTAVVAIDRQRQWSLVALVAIPFNVGLNYFLIPYFQQATGNGGIGAAIATTATEVFVMVSALVLLPRRLLQSSWTIAAFQGSIGAVALYAVVHLLQSHQTHWIVSGCVGAGVYISTLSSLAIVMRQKPDTLANSLLVGAMQRFLTLSRRSST